MQAGAIRFQTPTNTYLAVNSGDTGIGTTAPNGKLDVYNSGANGDGAVFAPDIDLDNNFTIQTYIDAAAGGGWANRKPMPAIFAITWRFSLMSAQYLLGEHPEITAVIS